MGIQRHPERTEAEQAEIDGFIAAHGNIIPEDVAELALRPAVRLPRICLYAGRLTSDLPNHRQYPIEPPQDNIQT